MFEFSSSSYSSDNTEPEANYTFISIFKDNPPAPPLSKEELRKKLEAILQGDNE